MKPLRPAPGLTEQVYQALLDEICAGGLAAGEHLVQEALAERLGVSRQPVQQALALLRADGLLEEAGRRGLRVAPLDPERMRDHYDIRAALDRLAARRAAGRVAREPGFGARLGARLAPVLAAGEAALAAGSVAAQIRQDEAFHTALYEASGNPLLPRTADPHWRFLRRVMGEVLRRVEGPERIWAQHREILAAVLAGEPERAGRLAGAHVESAAQMLAQALAAQRTG